MSQEPQRSSSTVTVNGPEAAAKGAVVNEGPNSQTVFSIADTPPDGGKDAWLVVLGSFLAMFSSFGIVNAYVRNDLPTYTLLLLLKFATGCFSRLLYDEFAVEVLFIDNIPHWCHTTFPIVWSRPCRWPYF